MRDGEGSEPALAASAGAEAGKLYEEIGEELNRIPPMVFESGRPLIRASGEGSGEFVSLAVPLLPEDDVRSPEVFT